MDEGIKPFFAFRMPYRHIKPTCNNVVIAKQKK